MQLVAAFLVVVLMALSGAPGPIDDMSWVGIAKTSPHQPSGDIVLVDINARDTETSQSLATRQAEAIVALSERPPSAIFIEGSFDADDPGIEALREAIAASPVPVTVAWPIEFVASGTERNFVVARQADLPGAREVVDTNLFTVTGFIFEGERSLEVDGKTWGIFSSAIAGFPTGTGTFPIDYRYPVESFPTYRMKDLLVGPGATPDLEGRQVVVASAAGSVERAAKTPTQWRVPTVLVAMVAAETLLHGAPEVVNWPLPLVVVAILLSLCAVLLHSRMRPFSYALVTILALAAPFFAAEFDLFLRMGAAWCLLLVYFAIRARAAWRDRAANRDKLSGLPNFNALEAEFDEGPGRLIVTRVDRYDQILASLEPGLHRNFVKQIAQRLSVGRENAIYTDGTGHFAWFEELEETKGHIGGLLALANAPLKVGTRTFDFTCSFGILDCPMEKPRQAISATVVAADTAASRTSHIAEVSEQLDGDANWQLALHASLDHAIANEQIFLVYQPQCCLSDDSVVGAEALVRWEHPERGLISPAQFIPQIEKVGRLKPLTAHTLRLAAQTAAVSHRYGARVSTNVSATLLADDDFVRLISENVAAGGATPDAITVEITETARIADHTRAARNLEALRQKGFHISLDDFGTGEANLSLLVALPCDEIKIDRSFVMLAQFNERARMIIRALTETARFSGLRLIAEGIETDSDREALTRLGCEIGQGYLFGRPMPERQFLKQLLEQQETPRKKLGLY